MVRPRPAAYAQPSLRLAQPVPSSCLAVALPALSVSLSSAPLAQDQSPVTPVSTLCAEARETARRLLTHYVKVQGLVISQMLRKSVETRDWLSTLEPRNVRAVMKRVVEDTTAIDVQVLPSGWPGGPDAGCGCEGSSPQRIKTPVPVACSSLALAQGIVAPILLTMRLRSRVNQGIRAGLALKFGPQCQVSCPAFAHSTRPINNDQIPSPHYQVSTIL